MVGASVLLLLSYLLFDYITNRLPRESCCCCTIRVCSPEVDAAPVRRTFTLYVHDRLICAPAARHRPGERTVYAYYNIIRRTILLSAVKAPSLVRTAVLLKPGGHGCSWTCFLFRPTFRVLQRLRTISCLSRLTLQAVTCSSSLCSFKHHAGHQCIVRMMYNYTSLSGA